MLVNKLYINLIVRIILITITSMAFAFAFFIYNDYLININLILILILQLFLLIRKMNLVNYELTNFFNSILYEDSSLIIKDKQNWKSHRKLNEAILNINNKIREIKLHDAASEAYFKVLVEHIDVGVLSMDEKAKIDICNTAFINLLGLDGEVTTSRLKSEFPLLYKTFMNMPAGEKKLFKLKRENDNLQLVIHATSFPLLDRNMKLISIQDIRTELDDRELETWQKMIRVLTHEIMNSISPVSSTIKTIKEFLTKEDNRTALQAENLTGDIIADTVKGLEIIDERSSGLQDFVQKFRSLTLLPKPDMEVFDVSETIEDVGILMQHILETNEIEFNFEKGNDDIKLKADKKLIQQVLINLINNSVDALSGVDKPKIDLRIEKDENYVLIVLSDNGEGIPKDKLDDLFIPFFTTREKGSGIGLSISKQIMKLHGGEISVKSTQGQGSTFVLRFIH